MKNTDTLKKNYEFKYRLDKGKYFYGKCFHTYIMKNKISKNMIGIAVSKKIGNAVKRNKIKRWVREAYSKVEKELIGTHDFIFVWKKEMTIDKVNFEMVYNNMIETLKKANIIR